jgi:hypothetical protein
MTTERFFTASMPMIRYNRYTVEWTDLIDLSYLRARCCRTESSDSSSTEVKRRTHTSKRHGLNDRGKAHHGGTSFGFKCAETGCGLVSRQRLGACGPVVNLSSFEEERLKDLIYRFDGWRREKRLRHHPLQLIFSINKHGVILKVQPEPSRVIVRRTGTYQVRAVSHVIKIQQ